jgi:hypothetical protein
MSQNIACESYVCSNAELLIKMKLINSKHDFTILYQGHREKSMDGGLMGIKGFPSFPFWLISASPKYLLLAPVINTNIHVKRTDRHLQENKTKCAAEKSIAVYRC